MIRILKLIKKAVTNNMKTISITNAKGGVGKTTVTINLAYELQRLGHLVLVIDLDDQCDLTKIYCPTEDTSLNILDVLQGQCHIFDACLEVEPNLYIIPGSKDLKHLSLANSEYALRDYLKNEYFCNFDFVLLDHPPTINEATLAGYAASNEVLIVVETEPFSILNLNHLLENLSHIQETMNPDLHVLGIVANKVDMRRSLAKRILENLSHTFPIALCNTWISNDTAIPTSLNEGLPVRKLHWRSRTVEQFKSLALELLERMDLNHGDGEVIGE